MFNRAIGGLRPSRCLAPVLAGALCFLAFGISGSPPITTQSPATQAVRQAGGWSEVDRLISEQKLEEAATAAGKIRAAAEQAGDQDEWTRALIKEVQLRIGLHGYETAVRFLKEQPWPGGSLNRAVLNLFYASALVNYYHAYSWEVNRREKVESRGVVDLKSWTQEQIHTEAQTAYVEVWKQRMALGREPISRLAEYLDANNYPKGVRSTLRDAVSYLFVELLADTSFWRPEQSAEIYRLDLKALLRTDKAAGEAEVTLSDPAVHPLVKIVAICADLESWHTPAGRREAVLEARLERLRRLSGSFTEPQDRALIREDLEERLPEFRDLPWWAMGEATLADMVREEDQPGKLVRARRIAEEGYKAYPDTIGGKRCYFVLKSIEAPDFTVTSMSSDGLQKRSIEVRHKNLPKLYLRAYPLDLEKRIATAKDYNLLPNPKEQLDIIKSQRPAAEWNAELPATPDFEFHRTFLVPPIKTPGSYVVVVSIKADFSSGAGNRILAVNLIVGDIMLVTQSDSESRLRIRAFLGESGKPAAGVNVALYRYDWQTHHQKVGEQVTDEGGNAQFQLVGSRESAPHFLFARKKSETTLLQGSYYFPNPTGFEETTGSLIYTDRSIYRPMQKILWKVLVYRGNLTQALFNTYPSAAVTVSLLDPNGQKADSKAVSTNSFGTAAGEFTIPTGRLLGGWRLESSLNGIAFLRVEEYKRPTFEVSIKDPADSFRLNRPATLTGEAKYYFGLPVTSGAAKWRVTREPVFPWWYNWGFVYRGVTPVRRQIVAAGVSPLKEDGTFRLTFTPAADERQAEASEVTYRYGIEADITDEGGETRSASRSLRVGFVAIEAQLESGTGFFTEGIPGRFVITRSDLNGLPRPGSGSWRLVSLTQPSKTVPPADIPILFSDSTGGAKEYRTPGDSLSPRWDSSYSYQAILRGWADQQELARGGLKHEANGKASLDLPVLKAGVYRLYYKSVDDFGATYQTRQEFIVAGAQLSVALPLLLLAEKSSQEAGSKARFLVHSGLSDQTLFFEVWRNGKIVDMRMMLSGRDPSLVEFPVTESERGGFSVRLIAVRDHQLMRFEQSIFVPWDNKKLSIEFSTFRDRIRPGSKETWRVTVKDPSGASAEAGTTEVLAYMYDRSLDLFAPHTPPDLLSLYPRGGWAGNLSSSLGEAGAQWLVNELSTVPPYPALIPDRLKFYEGYGIGGPGVRNRATRFRGVSGGVVGGVPGGVVGGVIAENAAVAPMARPADAMAKGEFAVQAGSGGGMGGGQGGGIGSGRPPEPPVVLRAEFAETAFWKPQLLTGADGSATIEFQVPDSVTSWNVWAHAVTRDLKGGSVQREATSVKDLMVRPYLPRFLREGDKAELKVVVNNASDHEFKGHVMFDILDPDTNETLLDKFDMAADSARQSFTVAAGGGSSLTFPVMAPTNVGLVAFKVTAVSGDTSDGELRPLPVLPGRIHLSQSRFITLRNKDRREMTFEDLKNDSDPSRVNDQLVVTLDAQLFYSVLSALPYLVNYPYECTEQTLNRFVSTGILSSLYDRYPAVSRMAQQVSRRETPLETWDSADPNRKMALEETPWLEEAKGGKDAGSDIANVLDPRVTRAEREAALIKLRKAQTASGGFPWWAGGPPSPYMTLYIMYGFAKASEFKVDVPRDMIQRGWNYLALHYREEYSRKILKGDCCWEFLTFLNYVASCYPDPSYMGDALSAKERKDILDYCFRHWKEHSPYLKCQLALTLKRTSRLQDASLVFASVMDSAKTNPDQGTFWAPEDRSWLWYNDTIETHAFALRTLMEITPDDARKDGLVQWLFLNKKLNHWKSTRATAEVLYSLVHYLQKVGSLGAREDATVSVDGQTIHYVFEPDEYTGKKNQTVIPSARVSAGDATIIVEKESPGFVFASAAWHFSTERLPEEARGDFLSVTRAYFRRENTGKEFVLKPLAEGTTLQPGDEVEVQLSIRAKHPCEYIHLRDPRAAGLEPENAISRYKWDLGIGWYEEVRDSGTNFFFEWLPQGEYTFKYRLRANMAGRFKVSPATLESMYAPEFSAYSAGAVLVVK